MAEVKRYRLGQLTWEPLAGMDELFCRDDDVARLERERDQAMAAHADWSARLRRRRLRWCGCGLWRHGQRRLVTR